MTSETKRLEDEAWVQDREARQRQNLAYAIEVWDRYYASEGVPGDE